MPRKPQTDRRETPGSGVLIPGAMYDTQGVMAALRFGDVMLRQLREEGLLKPVKFRGRCFYRGDDLIAMIANGEPKPARRQ